MHMQGINHGSSWPREATDGAQTRGAEGSAAAQTDEPLRSKVDIFLETRLTPEEFILETIDSQGGRLKAPLLVEKVGECSYRR